MSIQSEIERIKSNISDTYAVIGELGGTLPKKQVSANLSYAASSIPAHGVPSGGATGDVLTKGSATDYDTGWKTLSQIGTELVNPDNPVGASLSQKADAGPLEWYDLPLNDGYVPDTSYSAPQYTKTPWGYVIIKSGTIRSAENDYTITYNPVVTQLPEGYRPQTKLGAPAVVYELQNDNTLSSSAAYVGITESGFVQLHASKAVHGNAFILPTIIFPVATAQSL